MNKPIYVGLATEKILRLIIGVILLVLTGRTFNAGAQTLTTIWFFTGGSNGSNPEVGLVQGNDGNFYGTTETGGNTYLNNGMGWGTVFRISPNGGYTNLHSFSLSDGGIPNGLVQGSDSNFYGTTYEGGTNTICGNGCGTVFRMSPTGSVTVLWAFSQHPAIDFAAEKPQSGLVQGSDGNFYGTTYGGGMGGEGIVFRISPSGNLTNLHSFGSSPNDGGFPFAGLLQGSDGNFYGTCNSGGTNNYGTVFRISTGSYTSLHSFAGSPSDGLFPDAGLVQGSDGNFYGTTSGGGANGNGTVFRMTSDGIPTNLWSFSGNDGVSPIAGLVQGSDGNFYGTTPNGGTSTNCPDGCGTVFRITPSGSLTTLWSFSGNDGFRPWAGGVVQGSDGSFYGTTALGGTNDNGTVFKLTVPLNPPANQISAVQPSGSDIVFSIPSVAYETYQLQFSSSMNPTNWVNVPVSVTNSIGALLTLTNFGGASQPQGFYRFDITP